MYMGFMKMGLSLMSMFFGIIVAASIFELGPLAVLAVIAWFYSFFHVHNLAGLSDEEFYAVEDEYLFHLSGEGGMFFLYLLVLFFLLSLRACFFSWQVI